MTLQKDEKDKGWWRNPMSRRTTWVVVAVLAFVAIIIITNGIALF